MSGGFVYVGWAAFVLAVALWSFHVGMCVMVEVIATTLERSGEDEAAKQLRLRGRGLMVWRFMLRALRLQLKQL